MKLYLSYETDFWVTRNPDPEDPWDNGDHSGDYYITGVHLSKGMREEIESNEDIKSGDTVYVVWVTYDSGSTFGTSGGYGQPICITKDYDLACKALEWAKAQDNCKLTSSEDLQVPWPSDDLLSPCRYYSDKNSFMTKKGWNFYYPWLGYFEHNQRFKMRPFIVMK